MIGWWHRISPRPDGVWRVTRSDGRETKDTHLVPIIKSNSLSGKKSNGVGNILSNCTRYNPVDIIFYLWRHRNPEGQTRSNKLFLGPGRHRGRPAAEVVTEVAQDRHRHAGKPVDAVLRWAALHGWRNRGNRGARPPEIWSLGRDRGGHGIFLKLDPFDWYCAVFFS